MKACLDTHAVLWALADDARLGEDARRLIAASGQMDLVISDITLLEVAYLLSKGRVDDSDGPRCLLDRISASFRIVPMDAEIVRVALDMKFPHGDPFDRVISATAKVHGIPIVTKDRLIRDSGELETIW